VRRALVMLLLLPVFLLVQCVNWLCLLLDEGLFPGYHLVEIRRPVFVIGAPRSGTTMLHRVLSADAQFTTAAAWELWLAPSILQRKLIGTCVGADRAIGRPLARLVHWTERKLSGDFNEIHPVSLSAPEEDYFMLVPAWGCFILVLAFPNCRELWDLAFFDERVPEARREYLLRFYHESVQRHLYVHGPDKTYLNKNPSFTSWVDSLSQTFPDARFAACVRSPASVLPSLLSSMSGGHAFFDNDCSGPYFCDHFEEILAHYYHCIGENLPACGCNQETVEMRELTKDLEQTIIRIYEALELPVSEDFKAHVAEQAAANRAYTSGHRYTLEDFGLEHEAIVKQFDWAYERFGFSREKPG